MISLVSPAAAISPAPELKTAMRQLASGVSVVTIGREAECTGFTATSVASLSMEPPRLFFAINTSSSSYPALLKSRIFAVNFLLPHQQAIADRFAGRGGIKGAERFAGADWITLATGAPILANALASIDCEVEDLIERHSHTIVIGAVKVAQSKDAGGALIYWRGAYDTLCSSPAAAA